MLPSLRTSSACVPSTKIDRKVSTEKRIGKQVLPQSRKLHLHRIPWARSMSDNQTTSQDSFKMLSILQRGCLYGADPDYYYCDANFLRSDNEDYNEMILERKKKKQQLDTNLFASFANGFSPVTDLWKLKSASFCTSNSTIIIAQKTKSQTEPRWETTIKTTTTTTTTTKQVHRNWWSQMLKFWKIGFSLGSNRQKSL